MWPLGITANLPVADLATLLLHLALVGKVVLSSVMARFTLDGALAPVRTVGDHRTVATRTQVERSRRGTGTRRPRAVASVRRQQARRVV
jgi:hypothetical protein